MNTKTCTKCTEEKDLECFAWKNKSKGTKASICKECHNKARRANYNANKETEKLRVKQRKLELKKWYNEYKSTLECSHCGYNKHIAALQFHHTDDKLENISKLVNEGYGKETILKEIDKCVVLCANCHAIEHYYT